MAPSSSVPSQLIVGGGGLRECVCTCACVHMLRCPCCSTPLCSLSDMLPKVETRVVLVGEVGKNGALLKALQVHLCPPNPKRARLPTFKCDHLLVRTETSDIIEREVVWTNLGLAALLSTGNHWNST